MGFNEELSASQSHSQAEDLVMSQRMTLSIT